MSIKREENRKENPLIEKNSSYEPPHIEVVEVSVDNGFADSTIDWGEDPW